MWIIRLAWIIVVFNRRETLNTLANVSLCEVIQQFDDLFRSEFMLDSALQSIAREWNSRLAALTSLFGLSPSHYVKIILFTEVDIAVVT